MSADGSIERTAEGPRLSASPITLSDVELVARWNRQLQIDEGASAMEAGEIVARLRRWLAGDYQGLLFELRSTPVGYALYRPTDPDTMAPGGIYLRQFFIIPDQRRRGLGSDAHRLFVDRALGGRRLVLEALASNPEGQAFWRSQGLRDYSVTLELPPPGS